MEGFMHAWWHWLAAGLLLVAAEMLVPGFYLLFFGVAALATGVLGFLLPLGPLWLFSAFALLSVVAVLVGRRWYSPKDGDDATPLNRRGQQLVGRQLTLNEAIVHGRGRINIDDTLWTVRGEDAPAGARVTVTAIHGTELHVRRD
jgi:membrane protein implicated in regulation of membrane protease activity